MNPEVLSEEGLPEYASLLATRHFAHRSELKQLLAELWGHKTLEVLDVAGGDGFYAAAFRQTLGPGSRVVGTDVSISFLKWASEAEWLSEVGSKQIPFIAADAEKLPFADESFDLLWCAQSFISLPHPKASLREMARVTRPGGTVAILENDRLHELQLPIPPQLELELRIAERNADADDRSAEKPYSCRFLEEWLIDAGLRPQSRRSHAIHRRFPLSKADELYFQAYFHEVRERVHRHLSKDARDELDRLISPDSAKYLPKQKTFWMTWTDSIVLATR